MDEVAAYRRVIQSTTFPSALEKQATLVPHKILGRNLNEGAKLLYSVLLSHSWRRNATTPTQAQLAELLGVTERSISKYIQELEDANLLRVDLTRGGTRTQSYTLRPL